MKTLILQILIAAFALSLAAAAPADGPARSLNIYWDEYHDTDGDSLFTNYSMLYTELTGAGHTVTEMTVPITSSSLAGFDILVLIDNETAMTSAEIADIRSWIDAGHGLLLIGEGGTAFDPVSANDLLTPYLIQFTATTRETLASIFNPHPVTTNVNAASLSYSGVLSGGTELAYTAVNELVLSVHEASGKVAVWGDSGTFDNNNLGSNDEIVLLHNLVDWLGASGGAPSVDISCNGGQGGVTIPQGSNAKIDFSITAAGGAGVPVDIWIALKSPFGFFCYNGLGPISGWWFGLNHAYHTGPLANTTGTALDRPLPLGAYNALIGIDTIPNGILEMGSLFTRDAVDFTVY